MNICRFYGILIQNNFHDFYEFYLSIPISYSLKIHYHAFEGYCQGIVQKNL